MAAEKGSAFLLKVTNGAAPPVFETVATASEARSRTLPRPFLPALQATAIRLCFAMPGKAVALSLSETMER